MELKRGFLWAGIGALSLSALGAILIFLFGTFGELEARLLLTALTIGWYSMCSSATFGFREKSFKIITLFGIAVSVFGVVVTQNAIWGSFDEKPKMILLSLVLSFSLAHASILLKMMSSSVWADRIIRTTLGVITFIAGMLTQLIFSGSIPSGFYFRFLAALVVLDLLGTILVPIVKRLTAKTSGESHV